MIREDYIMRMIEQIGVLVSRILNQSVSDENVEADLEGLTQQWIGLPSDMLLSSVATSRTRSPAISRLGPNGRREELPHGRDLQDKRPRCRFD